MSESYWLWKWSRGAIYNLDDGAVILADAEIMGLEQEFSDAPADTLTLADQLALLFDMARAEGLSLADSATLSLAIARAVDENLTLTDAVALLVALAKTEALTLVGSTIFALATEKTGFLTLSEAVTFLSERLIAEGLSLVDVAAVQLILGALVSGSLTFTDAVTLLHNVTTAGTLTLSDIVMLGGTAVPPAPAEQMIWKPRWLVELSVPGLEDVPPPIEDEEPGEGFVIGGEVPIGGPDPIGGAP